MTVLIYVAVLAWSTVGFAATADLPSPAALFPLNAQFGTKDISGNHNPPGSAVGVKLAEGPDGKPGGSYHFDGSSSSYIEFPGNINLDTRYSITLLAMVYPKNGSGPLFNYNINKWGVHWWIVNGNLFLRISQRSTFTLLDPILSTLITNKWSYVGATYDYASGMARLWIDGKMTKELHVGTWEIATNHTSRMGAKANDPRYLNGRVSCLQVYNKALTKEEIETVKSSCLRIKPFSMCFDHALIEDRTRSINFITKDSPKTDYGVLSEAVWYRFNNPSGLGTHLASTCVPEGRCNTQATGWLNGSFPSLETGIAKVEVCFNSGGNCCAFKNTVYLKKCNGFYVYKFEGVKNSVTPKRRVCVEDKAESALSTKAKGYVSVARSGLVGSVIYSESQISSVVTCTGYCTLVAQCKSVNYNPLTRICELSKSTRKNSPAAQRTEFHYYEKTSFTVYHL